MKKTRRPRMLTVNGRSETASTYQQVASHLDAVASIRLGLIQSSKGAGRLADEVFDELEREDSTG
jgi:hypothetical protein